MKKTLRILAVCMAVCVLCGMATFTSSAAAEQAQVPTFDINLNGMHVDNASRKYPLLVYKDITYFPMTYNDCSFLGISTDWSQARGLVVNKSDAKGDYVSEDVVTENKGKVNISISQEKVTVNGNRIDNSKEEYPLFVYRDVTYFPLTWRFTMDEFGWKSYDFTNENGLTIYSANNNYKKNDMPATSFAQGATYYDNQIDGYRIMLPAGIKKDESMQEVRTSFEAPGYRLDVYRQDCASVSGTSSYISYSNAFTSDTVNFTVTDSGKKKINGLETSYVVWNRKPFTVVRDDLNKFACFDMVYNKTVYTLMFRYNDSISLTRDLYTVVSSFNTIMTQGSALTTHVGLSSSPKMNEETTRAYAKLFEESEKLTWGIFDMRAVTNLDTFRKFEADMGYTFPVQLVYTSFDMDPDTMKLYNDTLSNQLAAICDNGQMPELTLQTLDESDGSNMVFKALRGEYDKFLHAYAKEVKKFGKPVMFRFGNEMNGDWCPYSGYRAGRDTDAYIELYKYIYDIFQEEGADNCIWVWNPNGKSFPNFKWNSELMYYPGDGYVNVVGLTAYNTGNYYSGEKWSTFTELYDDLYSFSAVRYAQPLMITEFASSSVGGDKIGWINDMFDRLSDYPRIKVAVWWNGCDYEDYVGGVVSRPYYLQESQEIFDAFKERLRQWNS